MQTLKLTLGLKQKLTGAPQTVLASELLMSTQMCRLLAKIIPSSQLCSFTDEKYQGQRIEETDRGHTTSERLCWVRLVNG